MKKALLSVGFLSFVFVIFSCDSSSKKTETEKVEVTETTNSIIELEYEIAELFKFAKESSSDYDKTKSIFNSIEEKLVMLLQDSSTKEHTFDLLKKQNVSIVKSEDDKLNVFSWDDLSGGSMISYSNLYQYFGEKAPTVEIFHSSPQRGSVLTTNINQVFGFLKNDEMHYLVLGKQKTSGMSSVEVLQVISPNVNSLNFDDNLISEEGKLVSTISAANERVEEGTDQRLIKYNKDMKEISVLEISQDGSKTQKKYTFDGGVFK